MRSFACPKGSVHKSARRASQQPSGDSFRTSFPQGGVLRHQLVHLVLDLVDAWLKKKELAALLLSRFMLEISTVVGLGYQLAGDQR